MKLLYITNGINGSGGLERVLSIKASYLAEYYGYDITILSLNDAHVNPFYSFSVKIKMINILVAGNPLKYLSDYKKGVAHAINEIKPTVISVCDDGLKGFFFPIFFGKRIPVIYERHASINLNFLKLTKSRLDKIKFGLQYSLMKWAASKFDRFIILTEGGLKEWPMDNVRVIANPLSFFPKDSAVLTNRTIIAVGSHNFNKGYDLLLQAWLLVLEQHSDWHLAIYGKKDDDMIYLQLAKELEIENSVTFFDPVLDIANEYLNSSIMVLPSRSEGFGMVLIEAMACGVPCVSFDCPHGPADIIENGIDGFLVENGNIQKLAQKILVLVEDKQLRNEMGANARMNVKRYLPETIVNQWDQLFKELSN